MSLFCIVIVQPTHKTEKTLTMERARLLLEATTGRHYYYHHHHHHHDNDDSSSTFAVETPVSSRASSSSAFGDDDDDSCVVVVATTMGKSATDDDFDESVDDARDAHGPVHIRSRPRGRVVRLPVRGRFVRESASEKRARDREVSTTRRGGSDARGRGEVSVREMSRRHERELLRVVRAEFRDREESAL